MNKKYFIFKLKELIKFKKIGNSTFLEKVGQSGFTVEIKCVLKNYIQNYHDMCTPTHFLEVHKLLYNLTSLVSSKSSILLTSYY